MVILIVVGALVTIPKLLLKGTGNLENQKTKRDHQDYSIIKIGKNSRKSPGDIGRFAVTQTLVKIYHLTLV